ncbi:hypothetical protein [Pseudomonas capsici]|uniref:hypothetical protein n=1 Tax=Pseudomonas capsici TaxID=2810614 RepID=UPI000E3DAC7E|nr:hypothetical protein [Pseudomonas capsici]MCV4283368.1 hypothetical protein [Pseudomonas capsici]
MNAYVRFFMCLLVHSLGCVAYAFLNYAVVTAYKDLNGGFTSRGVGIGMASYALFYIFLAVNLIVAAMPSLIAKLLILCLMVGVILLWMLPDNPLRALFYSVAQGCVTLLGILLTQVIELRWALRSASERIQPKLPAGDIQ